MNKEDVKDIIKKQSKEEKIQLEDIPELDLYMDQVIQLFEKKLSSSKRNEEDKVLTKTMINNYAKAKLLMPIKNKKYSKEHLILMSLIYDFKGALSISDIKLLLDEIVKGYENDEEYNIRELYLDYLNNCSEDNEEIEKYLNEKVEKIFKGSDKEDFKEKFLLVSTMINMSNVYRKIGEKLIDKYFREGEEK
ncbi:MAG: DUF1836 domain-containing protein [Clostridium sp.]|nr:DUF1836 domain-containing protein [Clostridium sp.]